MLTILHYIINHTLHTRILENKQSYPFRIIIFNKYPKSSIATKHMD